MKITGPVADSFSRTKLRIPDPQPGRNQFPSETTPTPMNETQINYPVVIPIKHGQETARFLLITFCHVIVLGSLVTSFLISRSLFFLVLHWGTMLPIGLAYAAILPMHLQRDPGLVITDKRITGHLGLATFAIDWVRVARIEQRNEIGHTMLTIHFNERPGDVEDESFTRGYYLRPSIFHASDKVMLRMARYDCDVPEIVDVIRKTYESHVRPDGRPSRDWWSR